MESNETLIQVLVKEAFTLEVTECPVLGGKSRGFFQYLLRISTNIFFPRFVGQFLVWKEGVLP